MERKIGEKFTIDGKTYIVKEGKGCKNCTFLNINCSDSDILNTRGICAKGGRRDRKNVNFKEVKETTKISNMKPFNLEQAKAGKPVCTEDGCKARILAFDLNHKIYPIVAVVTDATGTEYVDTFTNDGNSGEGSVLMMATEKKQGWIGIFCKPNSTCLAQSTQIYSTKEEVEKVARSIGYGDKVVIKQIEWEE